LRELGEVAVCGPYEPKLQLLFGAIVNQVLQKTTGKRFDYRHSYMVAKAYGRYFQKKIETLRPDIIVAPAASAEMAFVKTTIPVIYITDGTFGGCLNYHKVLTNLAEFNIRQGNDIENRVIQNSRFVVVSSNWAAESVIHQYHKNADDVKCFPYGANFDLLPEVTPIALTMTPFKLLFVGVYWESKGGAIAYNAFKQLKDRGWQVTLTIMGCEPPDECKTDGVSVIPFLDKNSVQGQDTMKSIYSSHHLLLLPTRFDCTPIVINEASAFGIPSLVANSGGVAGHLKNGINGYLVPYEDQGIGYATIVESLLKQPEKYSELSRCSRQLYLEELNWNKWKINFKSLLTSLL